MCLGTFIEARRVDFAYQLWLHLHLGNRDGGGGGGGGGLFRYCLLECLMKCYLYSAMTALADSVLLSSALTKTKTKQNTLL